MKMKNRLLTLTLIMVMALAQGQTIDELRRQIEAAEREISVTNDLLNSTKKEQTVNKRDLDLVKKNIANRKKIVANLDKQITLINKSITDKGASVTTLEKDLKGLRKEYSAMIVSSYKNYKLNNYLTFLFAAESFNDAARRIYYIKRYTLMRENKAVEIDSTRTKLSSDIKELNLKKIELDKAVKDRESELNKLSVEEKEYKRIDAALGSKASTYNKEISSKRKAINSLQQQIQKIIAEEAKKSQGTKRSTTEQEAFTKLSGQFDQNAGKLPYPISGGVIIDSFGEHPHPTQKGLKITNTGVNIAGAQGALVRAVFDGEVSRVFSVPGFNNAVMIRHGNYLTVYANLEATTVKAGDKVKTNQTIGRLTSGSNSGNYFVHFEVWKETKNLDPELWLKR